MYTLHGFFTQNSMKPLYVLEELGVDFEFRFVNLMALENRTEEYGRMTPTGKAPVLEHDGEFIFESGPMCRYVASVEKSDLYPADKLQRARVDQWMTFFTCHPGRWLTSLYFQRIIKPAAGMGEPDEAACEEATRFAHQQLAIVENWLDGRKWLANDSLSIVEPFALAYLEQAHAVDFPLADHPRVNDWFERLVVRDSTARARARVEPYIRELMSD